jgi:hypothetical protein
MANEIEQIDARAFEKYGAARHPMALQIVEEVEYYAVLEGWYLGVLLRDRADCEFSFAILGPDPSGSKRWVDGESSFRDVEAARGAIQRSLGEFAA